MKIMMFFTLPFVLSSCMHLGMTGMMETRDSHAENGGESVRIEKEVLVGTVRVAVVVPPLRQGRETLITLSLTDDTSHGPISGRRVSMIVSSRQEGSHHPPGRETHDMSGERDLNESGPGTFEGSFTPSVPGLHSFTFYISDPVENPPSGEKSIEVTTVVVREEASPGAAAHGGEGISTAFIVGGVAMGAMMLVFLLSRGHAF